MMRVKCLAAFVLIVFMSALRAEVVDIGGEEALRLQAAGVPVIDVRTADEWRETGVIAGSHLLTFFDEQSRVDQPAWLARLAPIAGPQQAVVVICRSGKRSQAVSDFLSQQAGYATVYNVRGGILAWNREGRALAPMGPLAACPAGTRC